MRATLPGTERDGVADAAAKSMSRASANTVDHARVAPKFDWHRIAAMIVIHPRDGRGVRECTQRVRVLTSHSGKASDDTIAVVARLAQAGLV